MIRLFIAFPLSDKIRDFLRGMIDHFKGTRSNTANANVKWVRPENMHLTIRFLGDSDPSLITPLSKLIDEVTSGYEPIETNLTQLGGFPNLNRPRVIWIGMDKNALQLTKIAADIKSAISQLGYERETKPFKAHLTLGRVRQPKEVGTLVDLLNQYQFDPQQICFDRLQLIQSTLTPSGPIYNHLHESILSERFG